MSRKLSPYNCPSNKGLGHLNWDIFSKNNSIFGLVCAGGGAHGAYQVGVLKYIHEHFCNGRKSPFHIFAGSSCGSLNTSFYAAESYDAHAQRLHLEELWISFHVPQYNRGIFKSSLTRLYSLWLKNRTEASDALISLLDPKPMLEVIKKGFIRTHLDRALKEGTTLGIAVSATELLSGRSVWFQEGIAATSWNLFHSLGVIDKIETDHVAASCSVPIFLPPVKIGSRYFLDGSVSLDRPLSAAISMGANRILSISTDKPFPSELPDYSAGTKPKLSKVIRMLINRLAHDAAADEAKQIDMFNRFYEALSKKNRRRKNRDIPLPLFDDQHLPGDYRPTVIYLLQPSRRIRETEGLIKSEIPSYGGRTRFMFEAGFIRELIDFGYEDARGKHEELRRFFYPETAKKRWGLFRRKKS